MIHINKYFINLIFALLLAFVMMPAMVSVAGAYEPNDTEFVKSWKFLDTGGVPGYPVSMAIDKATGNIYALILGGRYPDYDHFVQVTDRDGKKLFRFGGFGRTSGNFYYPQDIGYYKGLDKSLVYILDGAGQSRVQVFDATNGTYIKTIGAGYLYYASGLDIDFRSGDIFVTNTPRNQIVRFRSDGTFVNQFTYPGAYSPRGIKISPLDGYLYVADQMKHRIVVLTPNGEFVSTFGSIGWGLLQFYHPYYLTIAFDGSILVKDSNYTRGFIQWISPNGQKSLGSFAVYGSGDPNFYYVSGMCWDEKEQNVYVGGGGSTGHQIKVLRPMPDNDDDGLENGVDLEKDIPSLAFRKGVTSGKLLEEMRSKVTVKSDPNFPEEEERQNRIVFRARYDLVKFTSDSTGAEISLRKTGDWAALTRVADNFNVLWDKVGARKLNIEDPESEIVMKKPLSLTGPYKLKGRLQKEGLAVGYWEEMSAGQPEKHHFKAWPGNPEPVRMEIWDTSKTPEELMAYVELAAGHEIGVEEDVEGKPVVHNRGTIDIIVVMGGTPTVVKPGETVVIGEIPKLIIANVGKAITDAGLTGIPLMDNKKAQILNKIAAALAPDLWLTEDLLLWPQGNELYNFCGVALDDIGFIMEYARKKGLPLHDAYVQAPKKVAKACLMIAKRRFEVAKKSGVSNADLADPEYYLMEAEKCYDSGDFGGTIKYAKHGWHSTREPLIMKL